MAKKSGASFLSCFAFIAASVAISSCASRNIASTTQPTTAPAIQATTQASTQPSTRPAGPQGAPNYPEIFRETRELLSPTSLTKKQISKKAAESDIVDFLQHDQSSSQDAQAVLIKTINEESANIDTNKHLRLIPPTGSPGYSDLKIYVSHPYYIDNKLMPASNLVKVWADFLGQAKKQIVLNVFDFDLDQVADVLVAKAKQGVDVRVGIDRNVVAARKEVSAIFDKLKAGGVKVVGVNPVSLNHQKIAAIDWDSADDAKALLSSGNLTQSCLGPEGDLKDLPNRPKDSIPNANHVITMKSWLVANVLNHELSYTLDPTFLLRGSQYPTNGAYQITGEGVDPNTLEAYPDHSLILTFTPGGGYRNINKNLLAQIIRTQSGPIRMVQFAFSSADVAQALLERAEHDYQATGKFDFKSVGDTPFAVQDWSQFLKISGMLRTPKVKGQAQSFIEDPNSPWVKNLSPDQLKALRANILIGPPAYGNHVFKDGGNSYPYTAKVHHKIMSVGEFAVLGTSFNFSEGAEMNNEQIVIFHDKDLAKVAVGIHKFLARSSRSSVYREAMRRNRFSNSDDGDTSGAGDAEDTPAAQPPTEATSPAQN